MESKIIEVKLSDSDNIRLKYKAIQDAGFRAARMVVRNKFGEFIRDFYILSDDKNPNLDKYIETRYDTLNDLLKGIRDYIRGYKLVA